MKKDPALVSEWNREAWQEWKTKIAGHEEVIEEALASAATLPQFPRHRGNHIGQLIKENDEVFSLRCRDHSRLILLKYDDNYVVFEYFLPEEEAECIMTIYMLTLSKSKAGKEDVRRYFEKAAPDMIPVSLPVQLIPTTVPEITKSETPLHTTAFSAHSMLGYPALDEGPHPDGVSNKEIGRDYEDTFM